MSVRCGNPQDRATGPTQ